MQQEEAIETLVLALKSLYNAGSKDEKEQAGKYLEDFQKGPGAWNVIHVILADHSGRYTAEVKVFCAQTLRSKVAYDLHQVPFDARLALKDSIVELLKSSIGGSKAIAVQLSIALANLAIQLLEWKNVIPELVNTFGYTPDALPSLLELLKVLPEELNDRRHLNITDEEYSLRAEELVTANADQVIELLLRYIQLPESTANRPLVLECFNSWLAEIHLQKIIASPLLEIVFNCVDDSDTFDAAIDCICSMIKDTREVDESLPVIEQLYPRVIALRARIAECKDDPDAYQGYTRMFAEAGESWHMLIARSPEQFRPLVESVAECTAFDEDLEVVQYTFYFWYALKQMLVMEKYQEARQSLGDVYLKLITVIIQHLHYPKQSDDDLFNGNHEEEDKFRSFRHEIGDVLKDCCAVVGASRGLEEAFTLVRTALESPSATWQDVEAPLFSMRAMAREVSPSENQVLPQIMQLLVQLPEHEKIRYAATLVLGRYTEWTALHPDYLDSQLNYITKGFETNSKDIMSAAAQALMHFCQDCRDLLVGYVEQLHVFYEKVAGELEIEALFEVTDGIAHVVLSQPSDKILACFQPFCTLIVQRLYQRANTTDLPAGSEELTALHRSIADEIELLTIFVRIVKPPAMNPNPISPFIIEIYPLVDAILRNHGKADMVSERVCKFIRHCMHSCGMGLDTILGQIAETLANQFSDTHMGCYLWVSGTVLREFSDSALDPSITPAVRQAVWQFAVQQMASFFKHLSIVSDIKNIPDLIEDFFRLCEDIIMFYPVQLCNSDMLYPTFQAALLALTLREIDPLTATLHFLQDLFGYVLDRQSHSHIEPGQANAEEQAQGRASSKNAVMSLIVEKQGGQELVARLISGIIYTFPRDTVNDASSLFVSLMQASPPATGQFESWVSNTLDQLPQGTIGEVERRKLVERCSTAIGSGDYRKAKTVLRDFFTMYARRNVTPRSSLGGIRINSKFSYS